MTIIENRKAALMARVRDYGGPLNELPVLAQFLAQVMHESGGLRYVREIWGPTKAQKGFEGRADPRLIPATLLLLFVLWSTHAIQVNPVLGVMGFHFYEVEA